MNIKTSKIKVGNLGILNIELPVITAGKGSKKVLIICGLHGNETSGLFIVKELLKTVTNLPCQLTVLPVANPIAQIVNNREDPTDNVDLNRIFPGSHNNEGISERIARTIFKFAKEFDLVIDLHTFSDPCQLIGIQTATRGSSVEKSKQALALFEPQIIWQIDTEITNEAHFSGALGIVLSSQGVANFAVETPPLELLTKDFLNKSVLGLNNVLKNIENIFNEQVNLPNRIPIMKRTKVIAENSGLFTHAIPLGETVKENQKIGVLTNITNFTEQNIKSPLGGSLIICKQNALVKTGDALFSIGITKGTL